MSFSSAIIDALREFPELKLIDAQKLHQEKLEDIPETTFYKTLSRLTENDKLVRLTKGIYCKPKKGRFGKIVSSEKNLLEYYLGESKDKGVIVGYRLFNNRGLTTQVSKTVKLYSNNVVQQEKNIKNLTILKAELRFNSTTKKMVELLEVLQEHKKIEDLNLNKFMSFIEDAVKYYDEKTIARVLKTFSYKKSTIASLGKTLDFFKVEHGLKKYLSGTSKYDELRIEELYEST